MYNAMKSSVLLLAGIIYNLLAYSQQGAQNNSHWYRNGPFCARIKSLAMAPSNPNVLYIGTYATGLYRTNNGGQTWDYCSTENLPAYEDTLFYTPGVPGWWHGDYYPVDAIAVDPEDENRLWIGSLGRGLFESSDGGNSWQKANATLPDTLAVNCIHINPIDPGDILLGTGKYDGCPGRLKNGGLYRSRNAGSTWQLVEGIPHGKSYSISSIERDPLNNAHILIGISSAGEAGFAWGIMESYNNGTDWQVLTTEFPVYGICINPANTQNMWGVVLTGWQEWELRNSIDGGHTWFLFEGFANPYITVMSMYADSEFNLYIERWHQPPDDNLSILKTSDNGLTWSEVDKLNDYYRIDFNINLTNTCQAENTNVNNIYFGNYYGLFHSENGGVVMDEQNVNLMNSYMIDIDLNPNNSNELYAGGSQGLWKTTDGGHNWEKKVTDPIVFTKYDPKHPDTLYYAGLDLMRSYDGGISFQSIRDIIVGFFADLVIHPVLTNILFLCTDAGDYSFPLYKSTDFGNSWSLVFVSHNHEISPKIVMDPTHPDTICFGTHRSTDGGLTWQENAFPVKIIGIHPQNSNTIYGTNYMTTNDIWVSYNWGSTFQVIETNLNHLFPVDNIRKFTISNNNPNFMYYCTANDGIHYSNNAGTTWQKLAGAYNSRTTDIIPLLNENKYYTATYGDGVWVYDTTYTVGLVYKPVSEADKQLLITPNPFKDKVKITYYAKNEGLVNITIYNAHGIRIITLLNEYKRTGEYELLWNGKSENGKEVKPGYYLVHLISDRNVYTQKVIFYK
jgi:hypothetical protein